jgi:aconitate hydratase
MGILPCQLPDGVSVQTLGLDGTESYDLVGVAEGLAPRKAARFVIHRSDERTDEVPVTVRLDTPVEVEQFKKGGIIPYVLGRLVAT